MIRIKKHLLQYHLLIGLSLMPLILFAQDNAAKAETVVFANHHFIELISHLLPMSLSPYLTLFVTSLLSKIHISTGFFGTHPLFNSWIVLILSFALFGITLIPKLFSKVAAPITLTANFLDNKASVVIGLLIVILPSLLGTNPAVETAEVQMQLGAFGDIFVPLQVILISAVAILYLTVVMTVRLFLEILIMLSPVPLVDTVFEIAKIVLTVLFVLLGIFFPNFAFAVALFTFLVSLLLYRRATKTITQIKYLIIQPVLHFIFRKKSELISKKIPYPIKQKFDDVSLAIPVFNQRSIGNIDKSQAVWLVKSKDEILLAKTSYLRGVKHYKLPESIALTFNNNIMNLALTSQDESLKLLISKSYLKQQNELETILGCITHQPNEKAENAKTRTGFKKFFDFFDMSNILKNRSLLLDKE